MNMRGLFIIFLFFSITCNANNELQVSRDSIVNYSKQFIGTPYVWGGTTPNGFDCSGFVYYVFKRFGVKVSRASSGYENEGKQVDLNVAKPADIMLFTGTDATKRRVGHVGMVIKNENGIIDFIHASSSKKHFGVTITRYNNSGYLKRFLKIINVL